MFGGSMNVAQGVLERAAASEHPMSVVMIGSADDGCGGYGRVVIDPWSAIEVRFFGWPMLVPGGHDQCPAAIAAMRRLGFGFTGADWVWRKAFEPRMVPVAAYAAARAMAEAWMIGDEEVGRLVDLHSLDLGVVALMTSGLACERCGGAGCAHR